MPKKKKDLAKIDAQYVKQGDCLVVQLDPENDTEDSCMALITDHISPCIGITINNKSSKTIALAHVDDTTTIDSVLKMIKSLRIHETEELIINIIGGDNVYYGPTGGQNFLKPLIDYINKFPNVKIFEHNLFQKGLEDTPNTIAITSNGVVYTNDQAKTKFNYKSYTKIKLSSKELPLQVIQSRDLNPDEYNSHDYGGLTKDQFDEVRKLPPEVIESVCGNGTVHPNAPKFLLEAMGISQPHSEEVHVAGEGQVHNECVLS